MAQEVLRRRGCGRWWMIWPSAKNKNWSKCGKGIDSSEDRSSFRHHNDSGEGEHGQRNWETYVNNTHEHKKVCQNSPKESASFKPANKYQCSNTSCTHNIFPCVTFLVSQNWKVHSKEPTFSQLKTFIRRQQCYLKHLCKITLGDASRPGGPYGIVCSFLDNLII